MDSGSVLRDCGWPKSSFDSRCSPRTTPVGEKGKGVLGARADTVWGLASLSVLHREPVFHLFFLRCRPSPAPVLLPSLQLVPEVPKDGNTGIRSRPSSQPHISSFNIWKDGFSCMPNFQHPKPLRSFPSLRRC